MVGVLAGAGGGNSTNNSQTEIKKYKELTSTTLSNESLINTVQNLVSSTISQTLVSTNTKIQSIIRYILRPRQRSRVAHLGLKPKSGFMDLVKDSLISSLGIKESFNNN